MSEPFPKHLDHLALGIGLGGVLVATLIVMIGRFFGYDFAMLGLGVFAAAQVAAIVLGCITRASLVGRAATITSSVLLIGSVFLLA